eukprot:1393578-Amorphochlora_amoeboformis.AAC.2
MNHVLGRTDHVKGSWMECGDCGKVVEERQPKLKHTTFTVYRSSPYTHSTSGEATSPGEGGLGSMGGGEVKEDDGFLTSYSVMESEQHSLDLAFSRSLPGDIIELQKIIGKDLLRPQQDKKNEASPESIMTGYITIAELCTTFGTPLKKVSAVDLFLRCLGSTIYDQVTNVEALAVAAYAIFVCREWKELAQKVQDSTSRGSNEASSSGVQGIAAPPRSGGHLGTRVLGTYRSSQQPYGKRALSRGQSMEVGDVQFDVLLEEAGRKSFKNSINDKEIRKHVHMISNVVNNEPVVVEVIRYPEAALRISMSKYFKELGLSKDTQVLAAHIGNQAVKKHLCYRRNSSSLSAASVYLACQLQGMRTTQNSFCKTVGLTEVTLRKVYKELKTHWQSLVPEDYKPFRVPNGLKAHPLMRVKSEDKSAEADGSGEGAGHWAIGDLARDLNSMQAAPGVGRMDRSECEVVDRLESFDIPKQYSVDGKYMWSGESGRGNGGGGPTPRPPEALKPYPVPERVYSNIPKMEQPIIVKTEHDKALLAAQEHIRFPGMNLTVAPPST